MEKIRKTMKRCPEGTDCPYKAENARKAIRCMPDQLKGQEGANMKPTELLYEYEKTGLTPQQIRNLLKRLKGECWLCDHSKPYNISTRKLSVCDLGYPETPGTIAKLRDKECKYWTLKQEILEGEGNSEE